jgi:hypothetical protein
MSTTPEDTPGESAYDKRLKKLTDEQLAQQALELKAKIDAHMKEMARRFTEEKLPKKRG